MEACLPGDFYEKGLVNTQNLCYTQFNLKGSELKGCALFLADYWGKYKSESGFLTAGFVVPISRNARLSADR